VADHFIRQISEDRLAARTDLDQKPGRIGDQDQVLRRLENAPPILGLLAQRVFGLLSLADVTGDFRDADDPA
jgi:hypothetical protein